MILPVKRVGLAEAPITAMERGAKSAAISAAGARTAGPDIGVAGVMRLPWTTTSAAAREQASPSAGVPS
jgi:hypothetical protein